MTEQKMTAEEWAELNATTFVAKQRDLISDLLKEMLEEQNKVDPDREREQWRRIFAAHALQNFPTLPASEAKRLADQMTAELFDA